MVRRIATRRITLALVAIAGLVSAAPAHAQFGKNKVQYDDFDFKVLQTEHFDIHYYPEEEAAVMDAARMAERAYARLSKVFRHDWERRKPLILYASQSDFQQTNIFQFQISEGTAGITERLRDRIVLFFPSAYPEFEHTLTHELVHAFQIDIMRQGALSQGSNPFAFRPPLWFMEGMAEYLSTGEIDPLTAMWLRDGSLSGYLTSIDQLSRVGDIRVYRFGQALWYYIGTKYGDEKIGEIMQKAPLIGVREAFRASLNVDLDQLSDDWLDAIRLTYLPQVGQYEHAQEVGHRLTDHVHEDASINLAPALSPDGRQLAFVSDRDYFNDIYIADAETGDHVDKLLKGERTASFESLRFLRVGLSFSPDGQYLAFSSKVGEQDAIYIMRVGDEDIVASLRFGMEGIETPSWSPDGRRLVFTGLEGGVSDLWVIDRDGTHLERLTNDRYAQRDPVWSPDGSRIAFTTDFGSGTDFELLAYDDYQIGLFDVTTRQVTYLPEQAGKNINPQWGPDGRSIAFVSDRTGIPNVFVYDFAKDATFQLTDLLTGVSGIIESSPALAWSRDGRRMVFSAFSDGGWDLYRLDDPLRLAREPWSPGERSEYDLAADAFRRPTASASAAEPSRDVTAEPTASRAGSPRADGEGEEPPDSPEGDEAGRERPAPDAVSYYLGEREAPRRAQLAMAVRKDMPSFQEPVDISTLLADPTIGLPRDASGFEKRDYKVKFQPDLVGQPEVGFVSGVGAFGASQLAFSDLLGDHNLYVAASVYGSFSDSDLLFTYANLKKRMNWGAAVFQLRSDFAPLASTSSDDLYLYRSDILRGVQVFGSYPLSRFTRIEVGGVATYVDRRIARFDFFDPVPDIEEDLPNEAYAAPSTAYVYDTAFYGSTGPIGGSRQRLEVLRAIGDRRFTQLYGDVRKYWLFRRSLTLATRALFLGEFGEKEENLRYRSIAGPTLLRGYDARNRDDPHPELIGSQVGLMNVELRFPLIDRPALGTGGLPPIRGAVWFDTGFARIPGEPFKFATSVDPGPFGFRLADARASFGVGLRMNLFGFAVMRLDWAKQTDMAELQKSKLLFTLAPEF
ncbi:MAG TPA: DPP IV N-terminal domain-containing protein [Gemmatimonadota bacterium]|jgi:Tol biopolymer transport system component